jgi:hypothetical protein
MMRVQVGVEFYVSGSSADLPAALLTRSMIKILQYVPSPYSWYTTLIILIPNMLFDGLISGQKKKNEKLGFRNPG